MTLGVTPAGCGEQGSTTIGDESETDEGGIGHTSEAEQGETGDGLKLDLLDEGDAGDNLGDCGALGGGDEGEAFSIIWIANSTEGTVSKVDTVTVIVRRLDGHTGASEGEVVIEDWQQNWGHGTYGGATDKDRNFWGLGTNGTLIRVDADSFAVDRWDNPDGGRVVYGIALDAHGNPWLAGWDGTLWRFEVESQTWEDRGQVGEPTRLRGLAIDQQGHAAGPRVATATTSWRSGSSAGACSCSTARVSAVGWAQKSSSSACSPPAFSSLSACSSPPASCSASAASTPTCSPGSPASATSWS